MKLVRFKLFGSVSLNQKSKLLSCILLGFVVATVSAVSAFCQEFRVVGNGQFAEIVGSIQPDGDERFLSFLDSNPQIIGIRLNSKGGVVVSAISMAEEISRRHLSTFIAEDNACASACAILFFAGHDRLVRGQLGVHQMDDGGRSDASTLQFVLAMQLDAFQRFGVPWTVTQHMLTTPPWDMYWLPSYEIDDLGLNRDLPGDASDFSVAAVSPSLAGATSELSFSDYPPDENLTGNPRLPDFGGRDAEYRMFRTRIGEGAADGVNFAGKYSVIEIGCGTSCRFAFVVDLTTGQVGKFPYGGEAQYQMKLLYSRDSRLLKVRWKGDWDSKYCIEKDMLIVGLNWKVLEERRTPVIKDYCDY